MKQPFVGPPAQVEGVCQYGPDLDSPLCGDPITAHVVGDSPWGVVRLSTCATHLLIAQAACSEVVDVHEPERCTCEEVAS